jgi:hypothetical protein
MLKIMVKEFKAVMKHETLLLSEQPSVLRHLELVKSSPQSQNLFFMIHFIIIFLFMPMYPYKSLPVEVSYQNGVCIFWFPVNTCSLISP